MSVADSELDQSLAGYETVPRHEIRFKPRRRAIARNLEASSRIPSLTADMQMDLTRLLAARQQWNAAPDRVDADRLAVMAMVAKAAVSALLEFTELNACYTERALVIWDTVNLGVAVDAPGGLMVPVIPRKFATSPCAPARPI